MNIYNEILVNARDQIIRIKNRSLKNDIEVKTIKVTIHPESGEISIYNDGTGIDVAQHPTEKDDKGKELWIPELIFGNLLTSTNYKEG